MTEIIVHEAALMRFLTRAWPDRSEADDLRQEVYIRVYEAAAKVRPSAPKSFLFTTARHLLADRIRRGRIISIEMKGDLDALNVLIDEITPERELAARQDLKRLTGSFAMLPQGYREIVWMRKVQELSQRQVAGRMGMTEKAVERRVARGIQLLTAAFFGRKPDGPVDANTTDSSESDHG